MFLPTMNDSKVNRVKIPAFSGGFNPGNTGDSVNDNQLIDCKNVWFKGGEVQTRPKLSVTKEGYLPILLNGKVCEVCVDGVNFKVFLIYDDEKLKCYAFGSNGTNYQNVICDADSKPRYMLYKGKEKKVNTNAGIGVYAVYCINQVNYIAEFSNEFNFTSKTLDEVAYKPQVIINGLGNFYYKLPRDSESELPKVTQLEGFNLLTNGYKATFTTDSISNIFRLPNKVVQGKVEISVNMQSVLSKRFMENKITGTTTNSFVLTEDKKVCFNKVENGTLGSDVGVLDFVIEKDSDLSNEEYEVNGAMDYWNEHSERKLRYYFTVRFRAGIDRDTGEISFPLISTSRAFHGQNSSTTLKGKNENGTDDVYLLTSENLAYIDYDYDAVFDNVCFSKKFTGSEGANVYELPRFDCTDAIDKFVFPRCGDIHNNLEVKVTKSADISWILKCNYSIVFGGSVGQSVGNRTFLAGNKNTVYFSDVDNPLYFPENCYFNIGDSDDVTAFAKMDAYLVIFKEKSIYYTYETSLIENANDSVVDITAQYKYSIKCVSDRIGCNLPNTIQMCMNRLIWTNKSGEVFTLTGLNNYSERNIYCLSDSIENDINSKVKLGSKYCGFSADWQGHYMLFVFDDASTETYIYLLDYNKNSYKYVASYTIDNNNKFSWWKWEVPLCKQIVFDETNIYLIGVNKVYKFDINKLETDCESLIRTKFFDFSAPDYYKGIEKVSVCLGNDYDSSVCLKFLTEKGELLHSPSEIYKTGERGTASYMTERNYYPRIKLCKRFGIEISSNGPMSISSVILNYNMKGSVKNGI